MAAMCTRKLLALLLIICSSCHIGYSQTEETTTIDNDEEYTLDASTIDTTTDVTIDTSTVDPCEAVDCNDGDCEATDGEFECVCPEGCEGTYCDDCGPPDVISHFEITMTLLTLGGSAATFSSDYEDETTSLYTTLDNTTCSWLATTAYLNAWVGIDCAVTNVASGMIVTVEVIVGSSSAISTSDVEATVIANAAEDASTLTVDASAVSATKEQLLQCPTCYVATLYEDGASSASAVSGEIECVSGEGIESEPCYQLPSTGNAHRCLAVEYIEDNLMDLSGLVRVFGRDCVSGSPDAEGELLAAKAVRYVYDELDRESDESNATALVTNTFVRAAFCDADDCLTDIVPCLDPLQAQCYNSSKCIGMDQFCDQRQDCPEGDDESLALCGEPPACSGPTDYRCTNETGTCIQKSQLCDLIIDCENEVDEGDCNGTCFRPSQPNNGYIIDPVPVYQNGSSIEYACNDGYTLTNEQQQCLEEAFDGDAPACTRNCREPTLADNIIEIEFNGTFDNGARYPDAAVVELKCGVGYSLDPSNDVSVFTCDEGDFAKTGTNNPSGFRCKNINECDASPCSANADCVDSVGSYACNCVTGYEYPSLSSTTCTDIDECTVSAPCTTNADCTNTAGSYTCACSDGYEGDGYTDCQKALFFDYYEAGNEMSLRTDYDSTAYGVTKKFVSDYLEPPAGFPFGDDLFNFIYLTPDGLIVLQESFSGWKTSYPYPPVTDLGNFDSAAVVAPFWTKTDFQKGGDIHYQDYYRLTSTPANSATVLDDISDRIAGINSTYSDFNATWALIVTYEDVPEVTSSSDTDNTNTYQCVLATDGVFSFVFFIYKNTYMKWQHLEQSNAVIGFYNPFDSNMDAVNLHSDMADKYMPDAEEGNAGRDGYWMYRMDTNMAGDINPKKYCEEWASEQPADAANLASMVRPCPCSAAQAAADGRYTECERYSESLAGFNEPADVTCYQHNWAKSVSLGGSEYKAGGRCSYDSTGALVSGYKDVWSNTNAKLFHGSGGGNNYETDFATEIQWKENEVLARYYCCKKGDKCEMYQYYRPALTCSGYQQVQPGFFYGDPHIKTLDGGDTYSFNGFGEYTMVAIDTMDFELQGRTDFAMVNGTEAASGGTVFVAFAAKLGITTVEFILNDNRTEFVTVVNGSEVVNATSLAAGTPYLNSDDTSLTLEYSSERIAARWRTTLPGDDTDVDFTVSAGVQLAMLDIVVEVPPEIRDLSLTEGLMGVYDGNLTNDFVFPNGSMMEPAGENVTEREIFDFGETWRTDSGSALFSYSQEGGNWATYNDESYVPPFLNELIDDADADFLALVYSVCGMDNTECIFDALATNSTAIGASTAATDSAITSQLANLNNFPPNISSITETSATSSLQDNNLLRLEVNTTYTYQIVASDANDDAIMYSLLYSDLGATVTSGGLLTLDPSSIATAQLGVSVSDGTANTSVTFKLQLCSCANDGECNWDATSSDGEFAVASCICTAGWTSDNCSEDLDSCTENPCYPGVQCIDQAPPEVNATCGNCPSGLLGDGFSCYDFDECSDAVANDCNQTCTNNLGSYDCSCGTGFELAIDTKGCDDVDECLATHDCDNNATCTNTYGSFTCPCNSGYELVNSACMDTDECLDYPCANIATCINFAGGHTCLCPDGYYGDGTTCSDIDECLGSDTNDCDEEATCNNLEGSYECTCNSGYEGNGVSCDDVNECTAGTATCHSRADCTNTVGSYLCTCQTGFIGDGESCTDIDECDLQIDNCVQVCVNTAPDFTCDCNDGFDIDSDGISCVVGSGRDCSDSSITCGDYGDCATDGNGDDTCYCDRGAEVNGAGTLCEDIDECTDSTDDCDASHGSCTNAAPGYTCSCVSGYALDNDERTCTDIDECATSTDECDSNASCMNLAGSYNCTCNTGYSGNGTVCTNVDECIGSPCHADGACTDTDGSYTCACSSGFQGDGYSICVDLDECNNVGVCDSDASCNNTDGSYFCTCDDGYVGDGETCADIDECTSFSSPHDCPDHSTCFNNVGSYSCSCDSGYEQSAIVNDAFTCEDVDECSEGYDDCDSDATCTNTDGSFTCACNSGYSGDGTSCTDIDECAISIPCTGSQEKCENRVGTYRCICQTDYYLQSSSCQASSSRTLTAIFSLVEGLNPILLFSEVDTQDNRDAVTTAMETLYEASSISSTFLGAQVQYFSSESTGAEVAVRLDFTSSSSVTNSEIEQALLDALDSNNFLGSDNRIASTAVTNAVVDPCDEGTHDCFDNNFEDCVFVSDGQFTCENCETGYLNETSGGDPVCTEIRPCNDSPDMCTDLDFIDCVHDSPGVSHCENCDDGFEQEGQTCVVYKTLAGDFKITAVQGATATYTSELADSSTSQFMSLATIVCDQVEDALEAQNDTVVLNCEVTAFRSGSIIADYAIILDDTDTTASNSDINTALKTYLSSGSSSLGVDTTSFTLVDICASTTCENSGWCVPDSNYDPVCECPDGWGGATCGDSTVTTSATTVGSGGGGSGGDLGIGVIIGIAVGGAILLIIIIIIIILLIKKSKAGAKVASADDDDDNGREGYTNRGMEQERGRSVSREEREWREENERRETREEREQRQERERRESREERERREEREWREERERRERERQENANNNQNNNIGYPGQVQEDLPENWRSIDVSRNDESRYGLRERVRDSPRMDQE